MPSHPLPVPVPGTTARPVDADDVVDYLSPRDGLPALTASPAQLAEAAAALASASGPVAVDAERASGFRYGQDAYLIQVRRAGAGTFLIDPTTCGPLDQLAQSLAGPEWILHAADQDLACLRALGLEPSRIFDTELAARILGRQRVGLGAVVEETLGLRLAKDHAAADWSTRPLPANWLNYAALDVEWLIELRAALAEELAQCGRLEWALAEFEHVRTRPAKPPRLEPWRRTPRAGSVRTPRSLAVLRELWTAREELARELDLTPSKVLPHAAVVAAAVARPTSRRRLMSLPEFNSRQARLNTEVWWRAVERALALPESQLPARRAPLAPGELPQPRSWERSHSEAAAALESVKQCVRRNAAELGVPQEILLEPDVQRHLAWGVGQARRRGEACDLSAAGVATLLRSHGARSWQTDLLAAPLSRALSGDAQPSPA